MDIKSIIKESNRLPMMERRAYYNSTYVPGELQKRRLDGRPKTQSITNLVRQTATLYSGFCLKNPISYISLSNDENVSSEILNKYYEEQSLILKDRENFLNAILYGYGVEVLSVVNGKLNIKTYDPIDWYFIKDENNNIVYAIYKVVLAKNTVYKGNLLEKNTEMYYVYDDTYVTLYDESLAIVEQYEHFFGKIPVIMYKVTNDERNLFFSEAVLNQCDQYDIISSALIDDVKYSIDSFLAVKNIDLKGLAQKDKNGLSVIQKLKEIGIFPVPKDGEAEFLFRKIDTDKFRFALTNIKENIYRMLSLPDLVDKMSGNTVALNSISGTALRLMFAPMEQQSAEFMAYFMEGLKNRIELINVYQQLISENVISNIFIKVNYNLPENAMEWIQNIKNLDGIVPLKEQISLLPFIANPDVTYYNLMLENEEKSKENQNVNLE